MALLVVIDDNADMRRMIARALNDKHQVIEAGDGEEGLKLVTENNPDVVITDILMPHKEGIQTIREVQERAPNTKIIAISGGGISHNMMFLNVARAFGADMVLAKPFRPAQLVKAVEQVLSEQRSP